MRTGAPQRNVAANLSLGEEKNVKEIICQATDGFTFALFIAQARARAHIHLKDRLSEKPGRLS
jgi:hypothetical protein